MQRTAAQSNAERVLYLNGLGCANCAQKILLQVQELPEVEKADLDFISQKLSLQFIGSGIYERTLPEIIKIVAAIEPGVQVTQHKTAANERNHEHGERKLWNNVALIFGGIVFLATMVLELDSPAKTGILLAVYLLVGYDVLWRAIKNIKRGEVFDENFLMSIATVGAIAIDEYPEAVGVMLFYQIGEYFQHKAVERARTSIAALMDIRPDFANLQTAAGVEKVAPESVCVGDVIIVKAGEKIPLDGSILSGTSALDVMALTGEALPYDVEPGSGVLSGSINKTGLLTIRVEKTFGESTVAKILDLVENAADKKALTEKFITKFARYYTPAVVLAALLLAIMPPLFTGGDFYPWINRALVFLVVSCPCALVISVPLSFFSGIGAASRKGILIKGSNYLEALNNVETVVFDKTGTLTKGVFSVNGVHPVGISEQELLFWAAYAESSSNHPIAQSVIGAYKEKIDSSKIAAYCEIAGQGVRMQVDGQDILAGNAKMLMNEGINFQTVSSGGTIIYIAKNGEFIGHLEVSDQIKSDSREAVNSLKQLGIKNVIMLTGDTKAIGEQISTELGLDRVYTQLLPQDKVMVFEQLQAEKKNSSNIVFVGDGINDAPVLARSDIGIAMGAIGSDAAIEAADIVVMTDEPSKIAVAINIARKTRRIVTQNIIFALGVKAGVLVLGALGLAGMWAAVFSDVGVAVLAVLNSTRALRI